jgi:hypothetical protein
MMPYRVRKMPNKDLFKVYSESGTPLSKKGLSKTQAEKQKTAATLSDLRQEGKIPPRRKPVPKKNK